MIGGWIYYHVGPTALWGGCFVVGCALAGGYWALGGPAKKRMAVASS